MKLIASIALTMDYMHGRSDCCKTEKNVSCFTDCHRKTSLVNILCFLSVPYMDISINICVYGLKIPQIVVNLQGHKAIA